MPPKNRVTKDEMIDAALGIVREKGIDALTSRKLGARMGSSTRPMFTYFSTVNELKEAVRGRAAERYRDAGRERYGRRASGNLRAEARSRRVDNGDIPRQREDGGAVL